jgi:chemotaxis family two-component system response regulator PixH
MNKALIVDDSLTMREVFGMYLQKAGFRVLKVSNVEQAQQTLSDYQPDLIILDVVMEGKSGFEFCLQLKKNKYTCSIPIIICSTKTTPADLILGDIIGADAYLDKNVSENEFVSTAKQLAKQPVHCKLLALNIY